MTFTREQAAESIARPRGGFLPLPFARLLDVPDLAVAVAAVGEEIRFRAPLSSRVREFLTLATAAACGCEYEWEYHVQLAAEAGLSEMDIAGTYDDSVPVDEELTACRELVAQVMAGTPTTGILPVWPLGRPAYGTAVVLVGYYRLLASVLVETND